MSLAEQITADMKEAMKAKDKTRLGTLRMVRAEILKKEKEKAGTGLDDATVTALLNTMVKQRRDSIEQFDAAGRGELAETERAELAIIENYLPEALSEGEICRIIDEVIEATGAIGGTDLGKVMGPVMGKLKATGKSFDGKAVNGQVKTRLGG